VINKVLCLTHSQDYYVTDLMQKSLAKLNLEMIRMDTDTFPLNIEISAEQNIGGVNGSIKIAGKIHKLSDFSAVWFRKNLHSNLTSALTGKNLSQATKESTAAKNAVLYALESIFWFDSPFDILRAENKQLQLILAKQCGLIIPNSLLSNSPIAVKSFYHQENGNIISKMLTPLTNFMKSTKSFVYTSKVEEKHLANLDGLKYSPMQFQQEIQKEYELRVIYVDGNYFTGKIATSAITDDKKPDWRRAKQEDFFWETYQLPESICQKIDVLMKKLSLNFGALDIIRSTNGDYVFLEVNPCGEWGMLQKALDYPITDHIAECIKNNIDKGHFHE
jgi:glutathione synthase/RimK-type ligase-like ATP-grasp enzyme